MNFVFFGQIVWSVIFACISMQSFGQHTLEFVQDGTSNSYPLRIPKGPTTAPQTLYFFRNLYGSMDKGVYYAKTARPLSVTFSFDDQAFVNVPQHNVGITFGAVSGASSTHVKVMPVVNTAYSFADTTRSIFTSHPDGPVGQGINLGMNPGVQVFLSAKPLILNHAATTDTSRYYFGQLRLTFSRPVMNPVISVVGLGATTNFKGKKLGFATELELLTPGISLLRLSGTKELILDDTKTKVLHDKTPISGNCGGGAACGSLLVKGSGITSLTFGVYLRADGGPGTWGTAETVNSGDTWHMTLSLPDQ